MENEDLGWELEQEHDDLAGDVETNDGDMGFEDILEQEPWGYEMEDDSCSDDWRGDIRDAD